MMRIPTITKNLLIINFLCFLAALGLVPMGIDLNDICGLHFFKAADFHIYQLFTYMFMHGGWEHIIFNMFALWMFGGIVERVWGPKKFLFYYIVCGVGAGLFQELSQYIYITIDIHSQGLTYAIIDPASFNAFTTVGASGAIYGIMLAFGMLFPNERMFIFPFPIPIKAKWFVLIFVAMELGSALMSPGDGVAHVAHLGGMAFGFFMIRHWQRHPGTGGQGMDAASQFFSRMKSQWEQRSGRSSSRWDNTSSTSGSEQQRDWDYNARKKATQEEIDRILDKIRKSGYDSLTREEKQTLFDQSNR